MKPMPKSLHTVTVIVKLAKFARGSIIMGKIATSARAFSLA